MCKLSQFFLLEFTFRIPRFVVRCQQQEASTAAVFPVKALMNVSFVIPFRDGDRQLIPIENKLPTMPEKINHYNDQSTGDLHALAGR